MKKIITICLLILVCTTSCGVMFGGSKFGGTISVPNHPRADIYVNGNRVGQGTTTGLYPRNQTLAVEVRQEDCDPKTRTFNKTFRTGNFILSVLTWGLIGVAVDLGTGAAYKPDHLSDPTIQKLSTKNFAFTVDYSECPVNN